MPTWRNYNYCGMKTTAKSDLYRLLPSVDELLRETEVASLVEGEGQPAVVDAIRVVLEKVREEIATGHLEKDESVQLVVAGLPDGIARQLHASLEFSLRPVINATGVILHTNLGRAPL